MGNAYQDFEARLCEALARGRLFRFVARGFSMSPFIKNSDVLIAAPVSRRAPRFGDVVVARHPGYRRLCVHRVIGKRRGLVRIKGDNRLSDDGWIHAGDILGVIITLERAGKDMRGVGCERAAIAFLSVTGILPRMLRLWRKARLMLRETGV